MKPIISIFFSTIILFILLYASSCNNAPPPAQTDDKEQITDELLLKANRKLAQTEVEQINEYISRYELDMSETASGLRYQIYHDIVGPGIENTHIVRLKYKLSLINGIQITNSDEDGLKEFLVGEDDVENGLHEAVQLLNQGDKAIVILPSHLAFGLAGDFEHIPKHASLVYDLEVVDVLR